jgi:hypothetical protein
MFTTVSKFEIWRDSDGIRAIRVRFSNGTRSSVFGGVMGNLEYRSFSLAPGEIIESAQIREDGRGHTSFTNLGPCSVADNHLWHFQW